MATIACFVVNPTDAAVNNINAGGDDVGAHSMLETSTLTDAEQVAALGNGLLLLKVSGTTAEERRVAAKILKLGKMPSVATS